MAPATPEALRIETVLHAPPPEQGLATRLRASKHEGDARRFAYPHRMMMVLADGKHFRPGTRRFERVALFFIDDAARYGLDGALSHSR